MEEREAESEAEDVGDIEEPPQFVHGQRYATDGFFILPNPNFSSFQIQIFHAFNSQLSNFQILNGLLLNPKFLCQSFILLNPNFS